MAKSNKTTRQAKFNKAMLTGRTLSVPQISAMGFSNVYDAAYAARNVHGLNVQRTIKTDRKGNSVSIYALEA